MAWSKIDITKEKDKEWVIAEYCTLAERIDKSTTILVYDDSNVGLGYRVWIGKTNGSTKGRYMSFGTQESAINYVNEYIEKHGGLIKNEN